MPKASRGALTPGAQGFSLAEAIDGVTPAGSSRQHPEPPPAKCRWCGTLLSIRNRPGYKPPKPEKEEKKAKESTQSEEREIPENPEVLVEEARPKKAKSITRSSPPVEDQLCYIHKRAVLDWHQGHSDVRPPFYPPEEPDDEKPRSKKL